MSGTSLDSRRRAVTKQVKIPALGELTVLWRRQDITEMTYTACQMESNKAKGVTVWGGSKTVQSHGGCSTGDEG